MVVWVGTSFKMNKTLEEALAFARRLADADLERDARVQRFVIPSFTSVREVKRVLSETSVKVGAQNMHWEDAGAWTGEVSPLMLKDCRLDLVELGHSERREHFGETDETVGLKVAAAIRHGLTPLVCIGETLQERNEGRADAVLRRQVEAALRGVDTEAGEAPILLAYEPVWAIGVNGIPATADYASERHGKIAEVAKSILGRPVPVLYGGSVNPGNCEELIGQPDIDGLFIGRSAWSVEGYLDILGRVSAAIDRSSPRQTASERKLP
ncbi:MULTISPECIES: triose-phosphate isomerase [unclassified Rhizobium]|uniref:triose-phosphate isomerase n=1 Tax=unclassified Rhizobium TaxID=2613769 RepID=UPI0007E9DE03|nr:MULTISPECIES: triose-phosphate isomerase [unclassified Rhizobium]ANK88665.1 triosephosphate isomerase 2 [Rhizobium sp. N731]ANL18917.1 triosephosphate isomerase 2 [Rhizobium sp. N1314]